MTLQELIEEADLILNDDSIPTARVLISIEAKLYEVRVIRSHWDRSDMVFIEAGEFTLQ